MNPNLHRIYYRTLRIAAGIGTVAVIGLNTVPHCFPQKTMQSVFQIPCHDKPMSKHYNEILNETCKKMEIDPNAVQLFYTSSFSTMSAGTIFLPNKSVIGIPRNYTFQSCDDIETSNIRFNDTPIDWHSNLGKSLQEVLLPNDNHLRFLIGHELTHIKDLHFLISAAHASTCCYGTYKLSVILPNLMRNELRIKQLLAFHLFFLISGLFFYKFTKKHLNYYEENMADEKSAVLGETYCSGGVDYMRKRLKLNRILRKMHGSDGEQMFSKIGNNLQNTSTHPKRTDRLKNLKEIEVMNNKSKIAV